LSILLSISLYARDSFISGNCSYILDVECGIRLPIVAASVLGILPKWVFAETDQGESVASFLLLLHHREQL
jgi:hypothetical protein